MYVYIYIPIHIYIYIFRSTPIYKSTDSAHRTAPAVEAAVPRHDRRRAAEGVRVVSREPSNVGQMLSERSHLRKKNKKKSDVHFC